jgi:hypothetical protein
MEHKSCPAQQQRIGWHYFPDIMHYRESDLHKWLPELQSMGASWLTLNAPDDHAIPEPFITSLIKANIHPILHIRSITSHPPHAANLKAILNAYASWGVRYVMFFDKPNIISNWTPSAWAQDRLVDRFLDLFLPFVESALSFRLTPILPPLEPGGNYWDTAFLRDLFLAINKRGYSSLFNHLILAAIARPGNRPINWGAGGPERWPSTKPYFTPPDSQDQCGFRIFDWYIAISNAVLGRSLPIMVFGVGCVPGECSDKRFPATSMDAHTSQHMNIVNSLTNESSDVEVIPQEVIACNFWLLSTSPGSPDMSSAWFQVNGNTLPIVDALKNWVQSHKSFAKKAPTLPQPGHFNPHPISHYLLLTEDQLHKHGNTSQILRYFTQKYKPVIGFSPNEAILARKVTIFGDSCTFSNSILDQLSSAGCIVERILEDGTVIASDISGS